ncbi:uncharacterized protein TNCV_339411 [Trichonephila clavipes]|nr:uncharacterized protein TNCV_339411 [Trichonephila clavipes]
MGSYGPGNQNLRHRNWFFCDTPRRTYDFVKELIISRKSKADPILKRIPVCCEKTKAFSKFRDYIESQEITVISNHPPLKWFLTLKSPSGRLERWILQLQSFNLKMEYIPSRVIVIVDLLSHSVCEHKEEFYEVCSVTINMPSRSCADIQQEQLKAQDIEKIVE